MEEVHQIKNNHTPVLLREVLQCLSPVKGDSLLDVTAGYGGHAAAILELTGYSAHSLLVDRDNNAISKLKERFMGKQIEILHDNFADATKRTHGSGRKFNLILADLGISSPHLDNASRGFSFMNDGPLDMRMDNTSSLTAESLLNNSSQQELEVILKDYGEEPKFRRVASSIIDNRPLKTTHQLAQTVASVYGGRARYKTHPATKTFQAIRIAVNDELNQLRLALPLWIDLLEPGGRLAVISFHSLEDRIVKEVFAEHGGNRYDATIQLLTKKPITGSNTEIVLNPRARSAKLRAVVKK